MYFYVIFAFVCVCLCCLFIFCSLAFLVSRLVPKFLPKDSSYGEIKIFKETNSPANEVESKEHGKCK